MRPIYKVDCGTPKESQSRTYALHRNKYDYKEEDEEETETEWRLKSVRTLIDAFEQKGKGPSRTNLNKIKSKSFANILRDTTVKKSEPRFATNPGTKPNAKEVINKFESASSVKYRNRDISTLELETIKNNALALHSKISNFASKDDTECISYQNQIIGLLTKIGALDSNGNQFVKQEKQTCLKIVQNCNIILKAKIKQNLETSKEIPHSLAETPRDYAYEKDPGTKVQHLKNIFERKRDEQFIPQPKNKPFGNSSKFFQTPNSTTSCSTSHGEYTRQNSDSNNEEKRKRMLEMSRSCEDVSKTGIRRLLEILQDVQSKKLTRSKSEFHIEVAQATSEGKEERNSIQSLDETIIDAKPEDSGEGVSLVSIKHSNEEDPDHQWQIDLVDSQNFEYVAVEICGNGKYSGSEGDSDSDNRRSSGFYSLVSDATEDQQQAVNGLGMSKSSDDGSTSDQDSDKSYFTVKSKNESSNEQDLFSTPNSGEEQEGCLVSNVLVDYSDNGMKTCFRGVSYANLEKSVHIH